MWVLFRKCDSSTTPREAAPKRVRALTLREHASVDGFAARKPIFAKPVVGPKAGASLPAPPQSITPDVYFPQETIGSSSAGHPATPAAIERKRAYAPRAVFFRESQFRKVINTTEYPPKPPPLAAPLFLTSLPR